MKIKNINISKINKYSIIKNAIKKNGKKNEERFIKFAQSNCTHYYDYYTYTETDQTCKYVGNIDGVDVFEWIIKSSFYGGPISTELYYTDIDGKRIDYLEKDKSKRK